MPKQRLQQKQKFNLTPQQIQFLSLLQIPLSLLNSRIQEELEENPALEESEKSEDISIDEVNQMDEAFICSSVIGILPCCWDGWKSDYKITKRFQFLLEESL